jgi:hypothetical protein
MAIIVLQSLGRIMFNSLRIKPPTISLSGALLYMVNSPGLIHVVSGGTSMGGATGTLDMLGGAGVATGGAGVASKAASPVGGASTVCGVRLNGLMMLVLVLLPA